LQLETKENDFRGLTTILQLQFGTYLSEN